MTDQLLSTKEIAQLLGVCQRHATAAITKRPDFPKPAVNLSQRLRRWARRDVEQWILKRR